MTVEELKAEVREIKREAHEMDKRVAVIAERMTSIVEKLDSTNRNLSRLVWLILAALVGGIVKLIFGG